MKIFLVTVLALSMILAAAGCAFQNKTSEGFSERFKIYTTLYPLYDFTKKIVGDKAVVENIVPAGAEPHDFEPSPKRIAEIYDAGVFIFLGEPMEPWAKKIEDRLRQKGVIVVEAGKGLIKNNDPHIWLDPILAKEISRRIYDAVIIADSGNKLFYEKNLQDLEKKFDELDYRYSDILSKAIRKDIITSHAAFGYLAERYGLNQIAIKGLSPQEEPSPKKMAELVELCKKKDIKYIFFESLTSPKLSETLAREVGAQTLVLNPIGGLTKEDINAGEDYFSIMEKNLSNLKKALY